MARFATRWIRDGDRSEGGTPSGVPPSLRLSQRRCWQVAMRNEPQALECETTGRMDSPDETIKVTYVDPNPSFATHRLCDFKSPGYPQLFGQIKGECGVGSLHVEVPPYVAKLDVSRQGRQVKLVHSVTSDPARYRCAHWAPSGEPRVNTDRIEWIATPPGVVPTPVPPRAARRELMIPGRLGCPAHGPKSPKGRSMAYRVGYVPTGPGCRAH